MDELLDKDEAICICSNNRYGVRTETFQSHEFMQALEKKCLYNGDEETIQKWARHGADCEVLTPGKQWRKGRVRICLVFEPDEQVSSALDEIRRTSNLS